MKLWKSFVLSKLWRERYHPVAWGIVAGLVATIALWFLGSPKLSRSIPAATMTLGIIFASFAATQRNMLVGMNFPRRLRRTLDAGYLKDILAYFQQAILLGIILAFISMIGLFIVNKQPLGSIWMVVMVAIVTTIGVAMFRNERLMFMVVSQVVKAQLNPKKYVKPVIKRSDRGS